MTVRDLIWVRVYQNIRRNDDVKYINESNEIKCNDVKLLYLALADIRHILIDADWYTRVCAIKGASANAPPPIANDSLPSVRVEKEEEEQKRRQKMTPEELDEEMIKDALKGKPYYPH